MTPNMLHYLSAAAIQKDLSLLTRSGIKGIIIVHCGTKGETTNAAWQINVE
jgi:hypothetical protein